MCNPSLGNVSLGFLGLLPGNCITVALEEVGATGTIGQGAEKDGVIREGRLTAWWFQIFFIFTPICGNDSHFGYFSDGLKAPTSLGFTNLSCFGFSWVGPTTASFARAFFATLRPLKPHWMRRTMVQNLFSEAYPIQSMYGIFTYIWLEFMANVGKYSIHGCYGYWQLLQNQHDGAQRGRIWKNYKKSWMRCWDPPFEHFGEQFWGVSVRSFS